MKTISVYDIARVCHEANRAYCMALGDLTQSHWDQAPQWQRESAQNGVMFRLANPGAPASAMHDNWSKEKVVDGWVYGPEKDASKKTHPCLVPFSALPHAQQVKDMLFSGIVDRLVVMLPTQETKA